MGSKATHFDGELAGIALVPKGDTGTLTVALLSDCKPAIQVVEKIDLGLTRMASRSSIEARYSTPLKPGGRGYRIPTSHVSKDTKTSREMRRLID